MSLDQVLQVHFVGSLPFSSVEDVFATLPKALPGSLRRLPDGELAPRNNWVTFQCEVLQEASLGELLVFSPKQPSRVAVLEKIKCLTVLETNYDAEAIKSYEIFRAQRTAGHVPSGLRFMVGLPTPLNFVEMTVRPEYREEFLPLYERSMLHAMKRIQDQIPHDDLAIQVEIVKEFALMERGAYEWEQPSNRLESMDDAALWEDLVGKVVRYVSHVAPDVELGFHFCYGDAGKHHFTEPKDTKHIANMASALRERLAHPISWIHLPVPKSRTDEPYLLPLKSLLEGKLDPGTITYLGLLHEYDLEGTRARLRSARRVLGNKFGVSTECGLGRRTAQDLQSILEIVKSFLEDP